MVMPIRDGTSTIAAMTTKRVSCRLRPRRLGAMPTGIRLSMPRTTVAARALKIPFMACLRMIT